MVYKINLCHICLDIVGQLCVNSITTTSSGNGVNVTTSSQPDWYAKPNRVLVSVDPKRVKKNHLGNEIVVFALVGDNSAVIPTHAFDEKNNKVIAAIIGEFDGYVLLTFPPSSSGTNTWRVPKDAIKGMTTPVIA